MSNFKVKRETDVTQETLKLILEYLANQVDRSEDEIERATQYAIIKYLESLGLPKGNKGRIDCKVDIYDSYKRIKLHITVLNWHKSHPRLPDTYKIESTLDVDTEFSNMKSEDFRFCIGLPLDQELCVDGATLIAIIVGVL